MSLVLQSDVGIPVYEYYRFPKGKTKLTTELPDLIKMDGTVGTKYY